MACRRSSVSAHPRGLNCWAADALRPTMGGQSLAGGALKLKGGLPIKKKKKAAKEKAEEGKEASAEAGDASAVACEG